MKPRFLRPHAIILTAVLAGLLILTGCSYSRTEGRKTTLALVDDNYALVPASLKERKVLDSAPARPVAINEYFGIKLNNMYMRYLEAVGRPEVVMFIRVWARPINGGDALAAAKEELVWQNVFFNSEDADNHMIFSKNGWLQTRDLTIMPPFKYEGQEVRVQLRVIEMDQADNDRTKAIIAAAAATAATFNPEVATSAAIFEAVLNFVTTSNSDDIEWDL